MERRDRGGGSSSRNPHGAPVEEEEELEDDFDEFRLPMSHRPTENLETEGLEQASVDTQLTSSNVGFRLLQKMGWKGKGLGKNEQGITEPIKAGIRDAKLGVGKQEQDDFFTSEDNVQRRKLNIELEETEEHIKKRELLALHIDICILFMQELLASALMILEHFGHFLFGGSFSCLVQIMTIQVIAEREQKIRSEVKEIQKVFFCSLCNKQYKLAHEFESHLSSYDHNHRKDYISDKFTVVTTEVQGNERNAKQQQQQPADAHRKQQQQKQEPSESSSERITMKNLPNPSNQDQRKTLKFGFSKMAPSKQYLIVNLATLLHGQAPVGNGSDKAHGTPLYYCVGFYLVPFNSDLGLHLGNSWSGSCLAKFLESLSLRALFNCSWFLALVYEQLNT
uniref:G-patch domain-containing protein n=1 Tax=Oryza rufipogon TaxID=4529 RepID=A0A0E0P4K2_ORYRU